MEKFQHLPEHDKIATKAIELLAQDERVVGLYLSGSYANGKLDKYSDIDLHIVVAADQRESIIQEHKTLIRQVGRVVTWFPATHLGDPNLIIVFYDSDGLPIHVDYKYRIPTDLLPASGHKNVHIVLDRDGSLSRWYESNQSAPPLPPPTNDDLQFLEDRFWGWAWYTASKIERGELWEGRDAIEDIRDLVLLKLAYYQTGLRPEGNRRLEAKFPADILEQLDKSIPFGTDRSACRQALSGLIESYISLMKAVLAAHPALHITEVDRGFFINAIKQHLVANP